MPDGQVVMRAGFTARKPALPSAGVRTHQQTAKPDAGEKHEITKTHHPMGDPFYDNGPRQPGHRLMLTHTTVPAPQGN
jgi:hypothetical protein